MTIAGRTGCSITCVKLRPLVLTGGPAVGKSSTATELAALRPRAAVIEVDDVRQMVVSGGVAPWKGQEGLRQRHLGVRNACDVAVNFTQADIDVVITDVLTPASADLYRQFLTECLIVRIVVTFEEAQRRAATRKLFLTAGEFEALHRADRLDPPPTDHIVEADLLSPGAQARVIHDLWTSTNI